MYAVREHIKMDDLYKAYHVLALFRGTLYIVKFMTLYGGHEDPALKPDIVFGIFKDEESGKFSVRELELH